MAVLFMNYAAMSYFRGSCDFLPSFSCKYSDWDMCSIRESSGCIHRRQKKLSHFIAYATALESFLHSFFDLYEREQLTADFPCNVKVVIAVPQKGWLFAGFQMISHPYLKFLCSKAIDTLTHQFRKAVCCNMLQPF